MTKSATSPCNLTALRKATRRVSQLYDALLAPSGLRGTQRAILVHVAQAGEQTIGEIATALVLDRTALTHNLKPLQRDGLVSVAIDKNDRRNRLVRLTKRGETRLAESRAAWRVAQEQFEAAFGAKEAAELRETLAQVAALEFGEPSGAYSEA